MTDEASAKDAVRMAGLPALAMGANLGLLTLLNAIRPVPVDPMMLVFSATTAVLLVLLVFRIGAGLAAWIPIVLILFAAFLGASGFSTYIGWPWAGLVPFGRAQLVVGWIVPIIGLIFAVGGLRGWRWMRANKAKVSL